MCWIGVRGYLNTFGDALPIHFTNLAHHPLHASTCTVNDNNKRKEPEINAVGDEKKSSSNIFRQSVFLTVRGHLSHLFRA